MQKSRPSGTRKSIFSFSSLDLSERVRQRVKDSLVPFDVNQSKSFDEKSIHNALSSLLKENEHELPYVTKNVFRYDRDSDGVITYDEFTDFCVEQHFGEMAIQRLHRKGSYSRGKERIMNLDEFKFTLNDALNYVGLQATDQEVETIFREIDLQRSGWITYEIYFTFLKYYFGSLRPEPIVVNPDQAWIDAYDGLSPLDRFLKQLLDQLREIFFRFDYNKNNLFEENEIHDILRDVFKFKGTQLTSIMSTFFNLQGKSLTFEELVSILLVIYFIQYVLLSKYQHDPNGRISEREFIQSFHEACHFVGRRPLAADLSAIFKLIDTNHDGWITFKEYCDFINLHFGKGYFSLEGDPDAKWLASLEGLNGLDRFIRMLLDQLNDIFLSYDDNKNLLFEEDEIRVILRQVFGLSEEEVEHIMKKFFTTESRKGKSLEFKELVSILLETYFIQYVLIKKYHDQTANKINQQQFVALVTDSCFYLRKKPFEQDLIYIFSILDTDHDGWISFKEYVDFIKKYLGMGLEEEEPPKVVDPAKPANVSDEEWDFINMIWDELKAYFDKYDTGKKGFLNKEDLQRFVEEVLNERSESELNYIFWNISRFDPNKDCEIEFNEFVNFILCRPPSSSLTPERSPSSDSTRRPSRARRTSPKRRSSSCSRMRSSGCRRCLRPGRPCPRSTSVSGREETQRTGTTWGGSSARCAASSRPDYHLCKCHAIKYFSSILYIEMETSPYLTDCGAPEKETPLPTQHKFLRFSQTNVNPLTPLNTQSVHKLTNTSNCFRLHKKNFAQFPPEEYYDCKKAKPGIHFYRVPPPLLRPSWRPTRGAKTHRKSHPSRSTSPTPSSWPITPSISSSPATPGSRSSRMSITWTSCRSSRKKGIRMLCIQPV